VHIEATPERIWNWPDGLPDHCRDWHPSHLDCRYVRGNHLTEGAILDVHERLHGKPHSLTLRADVVVPDRLLRYSGRGVLGAFILEPAGNGTRFTAQLDVGAHLPLIGRLLDPVLRRLMAKRLSAVQEQCAKRAGISRTYWKARSTLPPMVTDADTPVVVSASVVPHPDSREIEMVERKGRGHPDSICEALAEAFSISLTRVYHERCGAVLHHNVDKCGSLPDPVRRVLEAAR
jgi:hypothetical protein